MAKFTRIIADAHGDYAAERYRMGEQPTIIRIIPEGKVGDLDPEIEKDGVYVGHKVLTMTQETYDGLSDEIKAKCKLARF